MLSTILVYNGTGEVMALTNFITKVEAAPEQVELDEGQTLALVIHRLCRQASILWVSHVKEHPQGSAP